MMEITKAQEHLISAVKMTAEAKDLGIETFQSLQRQGEMLDRSQIMVNNVVVQNAESKRLIRGIKSIWGEIKNVFIKKSKAIDKKTSMAYSTKYIDKKTSIAYSTEDIYKDNKSIGSGEDVLLTQISMNISHLREIGFKMRDELDHQNSILDTLNTSIDIADKSLKNNTMNINDIMQ